MINENMSQSSKSKIQSTTAKEYTPTMGVLGYSFKGVYPNLGVPGYSFKGVDSSKYSFGGCKGFGTAPHLLSLYIGKSQVL